MEKPLANPELAILSLVAEKDRHGYEIEAVIEERGMRDWTEIGFSSIYHILGLLEKRGLVVAKIEPAARKGPPRKVYGITTAGRKAYRDGVLDSLSRPQRLFPHVQQGLAGLPDIDPEEAAAALDGYAAALRQRLAHVKKKNVGSNPFHVKCMFEYSELLAGTEAEWAEALAGRLRESKRRKR